MPAKDPTAVGLCERCRHARAVVTPRSVFWLCERSRYDASYERYPRLPMLACRGFEPGVPSRADAAAEDDESGGRK